MRADQHHWRWLTAAMLVLLLAAGCYQQGSQTNPEPLAPLQPGPTNTLPPTDTPFPTPEPIEPTTVAEVPTQDTFIDQAPTTDISAPVDAFPTTDLSFGVPTTDPLGGVAAVPTTDLLNPGLAQVPTDNPLFQEQQPVQPPPIDPVFLTATAIIAGATATESYNLTATAQGFGIGVPTFTPTPSPTTFVIGQTPLPGTGTNCTYTVQRGDNLFRISRNYNVDLQTLASYNNIANPSIILVGQQITIPNCGGQTPGTVVTTVPPVTGGTGCASPYTVQQGDTLFKISVRCGVPVMSIAAANGIQNINLILINQQLTIPPG
ncbi:MAG: LysM peptidoglycan-binding domain-containing protein [Chloroflexi bacterium]|nr:LysM peptidoglycan-binding domain-containing protein [Chloroflexota bacterium]